MSSQEEFRWWRAHGALLRWNVSSREIALLSLRSPSRGREIAAGNLGVAAAAVANDAVALRQVSSLFHRSRFYALSPLESPAVIVNARRCKNILLRRAGGERGDRQVIA
jgi:hypothetical protein